MARGVRQEHRLYEAIYIDGASVTRAFRSKGEGDTYFVLYCCALHDPTPLNANQPLIETVKVSGQ
jgi:hypothetical protein